jgi:hypothetical protein
VIPFLVLAIGVDNVFVLTFAFDELAVRPQGERADSAGERRAAPRDRPAVSPVGDARGGAAALRDGAAARAGAALGRVGPSVLGAGVAEAGAFMLGATTGMPAVVCFARFAAAAVAADVAMQVTLFPAALAAVERGFPRRAPAGLAEALLEAQPPASEDGAAADAHAGGRWTRWVLSVDARRAVLVGGMVLVAAATLGASQVRLGLEQTDALPADSFLQDYFRDLASFVQVRPKMRPKMRLAPLDACGSPRRAPRSVSLAQALAPRQRGPAGAPARPPLTARGARRARWGRRSSSPPSPPYCCPYPCPYCTLPGGAAALLRGQGFRRQRLRRAARARGARGAQPVGPRAARRAVQVTPFPPFRTKWTRRVHPSVLTGHDSPRLTDSRPGCRGDSLGNQIANAARFQSYTQVWPKAAPRRRCRRVARARASDVSHASPVDFRS